MASKSDKKLAKQEAKAARRTEKASRRQQSRKAQAVLSQAQIADQLRALAGQVEAGTFVLGDKEVALPAYDREVCLDLLQSKQDHLDRGLDFEFPAGIVCERCSEVFATMDLAQETCAELAQGKLPPELH